MITVVLLAFGATLASSSAPPRIVPYFPSLMLRPSSEPSPEPSPEPFDPVVITCRNSSCYSPHGEFVCVNQDNSTVIPSSGLTLLLFAERLNFFEEFNAQNWTLVPSMFLDLGFLRYIPWMPFVSNHTLEIHCHIVLVPYFGKPFVSAKKNGWCCPPCSWLSRRTRKPPSLLCCGHC